MDKEINGRDRMSKKQKPKSSKRVTSAKTMDGRYGAIKGTDNRCIGEVCYNENTNEIEVHLDNKECPPDKIKEIIEGIVVGAKTSIHLPEFKPVEDEEDEVVEEEEEEEET